MNRAVQYQPPYHEQPVDWSRARREASAPTPVFHGMVGQSDAMRDVYRRLTRMAMTDVPVLLTGESGTGKALAARALHDLSDRQHRPFVSVNCSALPPEVLDHELFGTSQGGLFESAQGGSLLLDEIGDLSSVSQARLCRVLEHGEIIRAAGATTHGIDVRVFASSHRVLDRLVSEGKFRDDLLYRLRIVTLTLPPLRQRAGDLPMLIEHFARAFCARHGMPLRSFDATASTLLLRHDWPGNVRELRNVIESALALADGPTITIRELPTALVTRPDSAFGAIMPPPSSALSSELTFVEARERALREFDRAFLRAALERHGGNIARTARALGLHRQSLQKLLARRELRPVTEAATETTVSKRPTKDHPVNDPSITALPIRRTN